MRLGRDFTLVSIFFVVLPRKVVSDAVVCFFVTKTF